MSYPKFTKALNDYYVRAEIESLPLLKAEAVEALVRDEWIRDKRYKELIAFILENWDSGNCDYFSRPFILHLIAEKENKLFKQLWKGILRNRLEKLWRDVDFLRTRYPDMTVEQVKQTNIDDYNQFSSNETIQRAVAWRRHYILQGINEFITGLKTLNETEEIERLTSLLDVVSNLEKPIPPKTTDKRKIDENLFWHLIQESRKESANQFNFIDSLRSSLAKFHPKELRNFNKILLIKTCELNTWEHWALAYIIRGGCGDDAFDYFKAWVVSKGRHAFESIKSLHEDEFTTIFDEDPQLEELYYITDEIYESKTSDFIPSIKAKSNGLKGKKWKEDKLVETFPSWCKIFKYS